jgi:hypothetical protein
VTRIRSNTSYSRCRVWVKKKRSAHTAMLTLDGACSRSSRRCRTYLRMSASVVSSGAFSSLSSCWMQVICRAQRGFDQLTLGSAEGPFSCALPSIALDAMIQALGLTLAFAVQTSAVGKTR